MFLNGILTNSEVWHGIKDDDLVKLEQVDECLLRGIFEAPSKTPKEALYLESGVQPIRFIIKSRRLIYLHHILTRKDSELISRILYAQKRKPVKGDWINLIDDDMKQMNIELEFEQIKKLSKIKYKKYVKQKIKHEAFKYLETIKQTHSKVKDIFNSKLEMQKYLCDSKFSGNQIQL